MAAMLASPAHAEPVDIIQESAEQIDRICKLGIVRPVEVEIDGTKRRFFMGVKKMNAPGEDARTMEFCEIELRDKAWPWP